MLDFWQNGNHRVLTSRELLPRIADAAISPYRLGRHADQPPVIGADG
jgi:hypothetical protein